MIQSCTKGGLPFRPLRLQARRDVFTASWTGFQKPKRRSACSGKANVMENSLNETCLADNLPWCLRPLLPVTSFNTSRVARRGSSCTIGLLILWIIYCCRIWRSTFVRMAFTNNIFNTTCSFLFVVQPLEWIPFYDLAFASSYKFTQVEWKIGSLALFKSVGF